MARAFEPISKGNKVLIERAPSDADQTSGGVAAPIAPSAGQIAQGDCRVLTPLMRENCIDLILTDPPYFLDGLDGAWRKGTGDTPRATGTIGGLPVGMKFDRKQGTDLQRFMREVADSWMKVLKPGGFALVFSQPRLAHRMAVAIEDAGFEIRDLCVWHYTKKTQFKAFSQDHFVNRMDLPIHEKELIKRELEGRKTPQLRSQHESIILAQKPREGTFVQNWLKWKTGLMDAAASLDGLRPSNVMKVEKAPVEERGVASEHLTPKPLALLMHLIRLFSREGQLVLDPFMGSGSTAIAAERAGRQWVGIELNGRYAELGRQRVEGSRDGQGSAEEHSR